MKKSSKKGLIAKSFPEMGAMMPAHLGSQSIVPNKTGIDIDSMEPPTNGPMDRGLY